jgi:hypothetical protein
LSRLIKKGLLATDPEQLSVDTFLRGNFVNSSLQDVAIGISFPPRSGNLVILSQNEGQYSPIGAVTGVGFIESLEKVKLFQGPLDQLVLNMFGGGSSWRHWAKDIYRWDGTKMRMIWAWVRRDAYKGTSVDETRVSGRQVNGDISYRDRDGEGIKDIVAKATIEEGVFLRSEWKLREITSRRRIEGIHRWDESLFYFVERHGEIILPQLAVRCWRGIPSLEETEIVQRGRKVGILEVPGFHADLSHAYHVVIAKETFCEIPRSAIRISP